MKNGGSIGGGITQGSLRIYEERVGILPRFESRGLCLNPLLPP